MARAVDYSARMDEADERAQLEAVFDAMRHESQKERRTGRQTSPVPVTHPATLRLPPAGTAERRDLEVEAARLGITPVQALLRRARSHPRKKQRAPAGGDGRAPGTTKAEAKRQRDAAEAARLKIPVSQLIERRRLDAAEQMRLHERAVVLGISVKELRRRGQAET